MVGGSKDVVLHIIPSQVKCGCSWSIWLLLTAIHSYTYHHPSVGTCRKYKYSECLKTVSMQTTTGTCNVATFVHVCKVKCNVKKEIERLCRNFISFTLQPTTMVMPSPSSSAEFAHEN